MLTGDFNAEPEEDAIRYLLDPVNFVAGEGCDAGTNTEKAANTADAVNVGDEYRSPFVDSYMAHSLRKQHLVAESQHVEVDVSGNAVKSLTPSEYSADLGYTFPACSPVKRIDFVLVRNATTSRNHGASKRAVTVTVVDSYIVGKQPTADTGEPLIVG